MQNIFHILFARNLKDKPIYEELQIITYSPVRMHGGIQLMQ